MSDRDKLATSDRESFREKFGTRGKSDRVNFARNRTNAMLEPKLLRKDGDTMITTALMMVSTTMTNLLNTTIMIIMLHDV